MTEIGDPSSQKTNPFDQLLADCQHDAKKIQNRYETHRSERNAQFKAKLLSHDFPGWQVDEILLKLHAQEINGANEGEIPFKDPRNNMNFYARPPQHIRELVADVQDAIRDVAPTMWFTPQHYLHMTTLEMASARTAEQVDMFVAHLQNSGILSELLDYIAAYPTRLVKPKVSYDASAIALSFVPAADEVDDTHESDSYSYHHLRRDLFAKVTGTGLLMKPRYIVPSAHVTIARFITREGFQGDGSDGSYTVDDGRVAVLVEKLEQINARLQAKYWPQDGVVPAMGEWRVGQEKGLALSTGPSWYGGGEDVLVGRGYT